MRAWLMGRYEVIKPLTTHEEGGVWKVRDAALNQPLALKVALLGQEEGERAEALYREFDLLTRVEGPHLASVRDLGWLTPAATALLLGRRAGGGALYLTRDFVDGSQATAWVLGLEATQRAMGAGRVALAVAQALEALHTEGVVHGDVKAENVLVTGSPQNPAVMLIDFGLSGFGRAALGGGTPIWMAPEVWGSRGGPGGDIYALGGLLYEMLGGLRADPGAISDLWEAHKRGGWRVWPQAVTDDPVGAVLKEAAEQMLLVAQGERPTARQVVERLSGVLGGFGGRAQSFGGRWPFLGRAQELAALWLWLSAGDKPVGVVHGPQGAGKTRLLEQARWRLQRERVVVFEVPRSEGAWEGLGRLVMQMEAAGEAAGEVAFGDVGVTFEQQAQRLSEQVTRLTPVGGAVVLWDDFADSPLEAQRWLMWHLRKDALEGSGGGKLRWLLGAPSLPEGEALWGLALEGLLWGEVEGWVRVQVQRLGLPSGWVGAVGSLWERWGRSPLLLEAYARGWVEGEASEGFGLARVTKGLSERAAEAGAVMGMLEGEAAQGELEALLGGDVGACLGELVEGGLARRVGADGRRWRVRWPQMPRLLTQRLGVARRVELLCGVAKYWTRAPDEGRAAEVYLQALEAQPEAAEARAFLMGAWARVVEGWVEKGAWSRAARWLLAAARDDGLRRADGLLARLVEVGMNAGEGAQALAALERFADDPSALLQKARILYRLGRPAEALAVLEPEPRADLLAGLQAQWWLEMALTYLRVGPYERAVSSAAAGLRLATDAGVEARLRMVEAAAQLFLGREGAPAALEGALLLLQRAAGTSADLARLHSFRAMAYSRDGDHARATQAYQQALLAAERAGLEYDLPLYLLNLGTAYHRRGLLGLALEYYAQGVKRGLPEHTRPSTRALLFANQANVQLTLGRIGPGEALLAEAEAVLRAQKHPLPTVEVFLHQLQADAARLRQDWGLALTRYQSVGALYAAQGDHWRQAEALLKAADALLCSGEASARVDRLVEQALALVERDAHGPKELRARLHITQARLGLARQAPPLVHIHGWLEALREAERQGDGLLVLECAPSLCERLQSEGMGEVAEEVWALVRRCWAPLAAALTAEQRRDLLERLDQPLTPKRTAPTETPSPEVIERFYRLLSLNARIINEPQLGRLLPAAMDVALALSGAERGFVLLRDAAQEGGFRVAISRDVDGEPIAKPHLKVSLTIARRVAETGEQVVTVNAQDDARFNAALSVHRLELTSVLCVPICDRAQVLGTLYLDHRFRPDMFGGEAARMMRAFADQLALALVGAQRLQALSEERESLANARQQVESLLAEKEALLSDLNTRYQTLSREVEHKDAALRTRHQYANIVAASRRMQQVLAQLDRVVESRIPVLILGDSGTGKELVARAIHFNGPRAQKPFIAFNCGAVSEALVDSELFGHTKGAFTGADRARDGLFVAADGGTLFLDELGEMSAATQVKLLRALQERRIRPVGAAHEREVDVRIVAATNRDLQREVSEGRFREDLYWRLAAFAITLPPLCERREDIPHLVRHLLRRFHAEEALPERGIGHEAMTFLYHQPWPGNVRQLENTLRTAAVFAASDEIGLRDVQSVVEPAATSTKKQPHRQPNGPETPRRGRRPQLDLAQVQRALAQANNDRRAAALRLGVSERTLYRYLQQMSVEPK